MDSRRTAAEMYIMFGGVQGSQRNDVWARVLLDLYKRLGERKARVSALSAGGAPVESTPFERLGLRLAGFQKVPLFEYSELRTRRIYLIRMNIYPTFFFYHDGIIGSS